MMDMIKAIIFDLGKVVFDLSFDRVFQSWANASGKTFQDIKNQFQFDELFDKFECKEISPEEFRTKLSDNLGFHLTDQAFDKGWCNLYMDIYKGMDSLLITLKHNYTLLL